MDFKIIDRKQFYQGKIFNLQKVQVRLPDGREPTYELIDHPGAVAMIARDGQGNILFVRQFRAGVGGELLEIPAGTLHEGEEPLLCAERELREEIGMAARDLKKLGQLPCPGLFQRTFAYIPGRRSLSISSGKRR